MRLSASEIAYHNDILTLFYKITGSKLTYCEFGTTSVLNSPPLESPYYEHIPAYVEPRTRDIDLPNNVLPSPPIIDLPNTPVDSPNISDFPTYTPERNTESIPNTVVDTNLVNVAQYEIPTTGSWTREGKSEKQWLNTHGYGKGKVVTRSNSFPGEKSWELLDSQVNVIGRIDHEFKIHGSNGYVMTPPNVHIFIDPYNIHHYFDSIN